jgi:hypothetical protein
MDIYVTPDFSALFRAADLRRRPARNRLRVVAGSDSFGIRALETDGFVLESPDAPNLRGHVDIYNGTEHLFQALIVRGEAAPGGARYDFKRRTSARDQAPRDFAVDPQAPAGLLPAR